MLYAIFTVVIILQLSFLFRQYSKEAEKWSQIVLPLESRIALSGIVFIAGPALAFYSTADIINLKQLGTIYGIAFCISVIAIAAASIQPSLLLLGVLLGGVNIFLAHSELTKVLPSGDTIIHASGLLLTLMLALYGALFFEIRRSQKLNHQRKHHGNLG